ncbi:diacylglycerol kinase family protein [Tsuneonella sp. YG55]|uniref:Diacylglycerol kinase family protein n=1 Tax=Tsuneonella litorea TaxID=2976475 RepID=A0A9X2W2P3_9SPHN|nr:diacylglycerol kinase family protein [Tsuneonella litorea]MCT2559642.1 diacylglycerol kinase family protein [Tsuneonella litorea]
MKLDLVYNPMAGSFRQARLDALARAFEGHGWDVRRVPSARAWSPAGDPPDIACVHGGDGTLRDAVQALGALAGRVPLCIAPSGTINLVARELGYPGDPDRLAAQVTTAWRRGPEAWVAAPLYRLGDLPVVSCLSIGPDSHAVAHVSSALKKRIGRLAYVAAMLRVMRRWPRQTMRVSGELADGTRFACEAGAVIVSHGALFAGPFRLSPNAALAADSVELIVLDRPSRVGVLAFTAAAFAGLPLDRLGLATFRSARRVEFDRCASPVQVDGDHIPGIGGECAFAVEPTGMTLRYVV